MVRERISCTHTDSKEGVLQVLNARLRMEGPGGASYYSFSPHAAWRIVVLDGYDVSLLGWPPEHPLHQQALQILDKHNPNQAGCRTPHPADLHAKNGQFNASMPGVHVRWHYSHVPVPKAMRPVSAWSYPFAYVTIVLI